jgi:signal peptidase I
VPAVSAQAVCPNCGFAENDLNAVAAGGGDRLLVDKAAFRLRRPRRWEVVAFRGPGDSRICVKRIVGLPGETVQIRKGNVYIDDRILQKTLAEQRAIAAPVHDAAYPPRLDLPSPVGWRPDRPASGWSFSGTRFIHSETPGESSFDWLAFHHGARVPGEPARAFETPITDACSYNQTRPRRGSPIHSARDLLVSFRLAEVAGEGALAVRAVDSGGPISFHLETRDGRSLAWIQRGERRIGSTQSLGRYGLAGRRSSAALIEVSLFDGQFLGAVDGRPVVATPLEMGGEEARGSQESHRLAIGVQGLAVKIEDLKVLRDVYYTRPLGLADRWGSDTPVVLGEDEYFVLGDNSAVSEDSRTWPDGPAVLAQQLIGKAFLVHLPVRKRRVLGWDFSVPDIARVRYIR